MTKRGAAAILERLRALQNIITIPDRKTPLLGERRCDYAAV